MDLTAIKDSLETIVTYVTYYSFVASAGVFGYTIYSIFKKDYTNENKQLGFDFMKDINKYKTK